MKFPSGLFVQQAVAKGGAILQQDGEIILPPVLQPILEISSPFFKMSQAATTANSFLTFNTVSTSGVAAADTTDMASLVAGIWSLVISYAWNFSGTTDVTKIFTLLLQDLVPNQQRLFALPFITGAQADSVLQFMIAIAETLTLRMSVPARIAGDVSFAHVSILAKKII